MLPDIRAVIAALFAAVGLLMIAFGAVATFRVAQDNHGALQADLAKRGRAAAPPPGQQTVAVIATPGPHIAPFPPLPVVEVRDTPIAEVREAPPSSPPSPSMAVSVPPSPPPPAEPAIGGPLAGAGPGEAERAAERKANRAAAKKARAARLARQRKAARRAALVRAKQKQTATPSYNSFGNSSFGAGAAKQ